MVIDMRNIYLGVEHFWTFDQNGNEVKGMAISMYCLYQEFGLGEIYRRDFINLETGEKIQIDEKGNVTRQEDSNIVSFKVDNIHSLQDTLNTIIEYDTEMFNSIEDAKETYTYIETLANHINTMEMQNNPAYLEADCLPTLVDMTLGLFSLAYGNPLSNESRTKCLYRFKNHFLGGEQDGI